MIFKIMTLFPEMIETVLSESIIGRAKNFGLIDVKAVNIRDYTKDKHRQVDDYPYGGGAGMLMMAEPVYACYEDITKNSVKKPRVLFMDPKGVTFNQQMAKELAQEEELVFLCGHYEGIDERVLEEIVTDRVSIGDFVLSGGEIPAMAMIDAVARMVPGVLTNSESGVEESFESFLLEYPQYTRPVEWHEIRVPDVLMSGHHANIQKWRREFKCISFSRSLCKYGFTNY